MEVPQESAVIAGRYRLEALIGEGGMASVWRARDLTLQRTVALKLLYARDDRDKQALVDQFLREARIAAAVDHRNVIHIVDFGTTDGDQPFMVMEFLEGTTLGDRLQRGPPLTLPELVHVASLTLRGLAAVHEAGIIHRDLKPDNIFLKEEAGGGYFPKILDFGISRSVEPASGRRSALTTREGIIVGTPEYMSPEQARGIRTVDKRTDIYSMGAILYEALTGQLAFESENVGDLIIQIVTGTASHVCDINPQIPRVISDVVAKAMARSPDERFQSALEMQQALLAAADQSLGDVQRSLSDRPPAVSTPPRAASGPSAIAVSSPPAPSTAEERLSQDRLRTLELPLEPSGELELDVPRADPTPSVPSVAPASLPPEPPTRRTALWVVLGGAVGLGVLLGGVLGDAPPSGERGMHPVGAMPAPSGEPVSSAAPARLSSVRLRNVPPDATVTVDGRPAAGDALELPLDGVERVIEVRAPNREPWRVVHTSSRDAVYDVWLAQVEATVPAPAPPAPQAQAQPAPTKSTARTSKLTVRTRPTKTTKKKPPSVLRTLDF